MFIITPLVNSLNRIISVRDAIYFVFTSGSSAYVPPAVPVRAAMDRTAARGSREGRHLMRRSCDTHTNASARVHAPTYK